MINLEAEKTEIKTQHRNWGNKYLYPGEILGIRRKFVN